MGTLAVRSSRSVGRLLRQRRESLGWTLREVERRARVEAGERIPASTLARIEQGKLDPGVPRLHLLTRLYDIPPDLVADLVEVESRAIEPATRDLRTLLEEGDRLWKAGHVDAAIGHTLALREIVPDTPEARLLRQSATLRFANHARRLGKLRLARRLLEDLLCEPPDPSLATDALIVAASLWRALGALDVAVALVREAAGRVSPDRPTEYARVRHQEAKILLDANRLEAASDALDAALEAYGRCEDPLNADQARVLRVAVLERNGKLDEAVTAAGEALQSATAHGHGLVALFARVERGRSLAVGGRVGEAIIELNQALAEALARNDRNAEFHVRYALWKAHESAGDAPSAAAALERAKELAATMDEKSKEIEEVRSRRPR